MPHRRKKEVSSHEEHRSRPWWLCGWRWLGGRLQDPETRRLQRQHRPESDDIVGGRRSSYQANSCSAGRTYNSRWILEDRKSTRLNSSHLGISYAVFCLNKKKIDLLYVTDM